MNQMQQAHPAANNTALVERNSLMGQEMAHLNDQTSVLAQQVVAQVQARYILAVNRPRNIDFVRQNILKECQRPSFAEVARYNKPIGNGITGPSIRFAEAAIRYMGNIATEEMVISDTPEYRIVRVTVSDIETNVSYYKDIRVEKLVERNSLRSGQQALRTRHNSYGKVVYIVEATEDELTTKLSAQVSKAIRTQSLRLIPGDIIDEAMDAVMATQRNEAKRDPEATRKRMVDKFATVGVSAEMLAKYLHTNDLSSITPDVYEHLGAVYAAIKDGEAKWAEVMQASPYIPSAEKGEEGDAKANELRDKLAKKSEERKAKKAAPKQESEPTEPTEQAPIEPKATAKGKQEVPEVAPAGRLPEHVMDMLAAALTAGLPDDDWPAIIEAINSQTLANTTIAPIASLADIDKTVAQMVIMDIEGGRLNWGAA